MAGCLLVAEGVAQTLGGNAAFNFLNNSVGARTAALGGLNISGINNDVSVTFQNPALLRPVHHGQISSNFNSWVAGISNYSLVAASQIPSIGCIAGIGVNYFNYGTLTQTDAAGNILGQFRPMDYVVQGMLSKQYKERFTGGVTLKYIQSNYGMFRSAGIAVDVGVVYRDSAAGWQASVLVKNMGTQLSAYMPGTAKEEIPFDLQAGISKRLANAPFQFSLTARQLHRFNTLYNDTTFRAEEGEINYTSVSTLQKVLAHLTVGVQVYPHEKLELMAGYSFRRRSELNVFNQVAGLNVFTFGTALQLKKMHIQYATGLYQRNLFHQFTINVNWQGNL